VRFRNDVAEIGMRRADEEKDETALHNLDLSARGHKSAGILYSVATLNVLRICYSIKLASNAKVVIE
jgi:hypothetical protein